ncbi:MAG: exported protein of unknown function [Promethearchaeota archaeon]|nr:MAG: exported protein of unknown function [Candidatus Lokiarchaeota archaeon]
MNRKIISVSFVLVALISLSFLTYIPVESPYPFIKLQNTSIIESADSPMYIEKKAVEFQINNHTALSQSYCSLAALTNDTFAIAWHSSGQDGNGWGVYASVFNATTGTNITEEFRVNEYIANDQQYPSLAALTSDTFVIAWESSSQDSSGWGIYARVFNATNGSNITEEFRVNTYTTNAQRFPSVAALTNETFVIAWQSNGQDGDSDGIYASMFNASTGAKIIADFRVNDYITNAQQNPSVTAFTDDTVAIAWQSNGQDGNFWGVYACVFNVTTGTNITSEFKVNDFTTFDQMCPSAAALTDDTVAISWHSNNQDGSDWGVYARVFNSTNGLNITKEFRVNTYTDGDQRYPSVATLTDDTFVITWHSNNQDGNGYGVYAKVFSATTEANITVEFQINNYTTSNQRYPAVTALNEHIFAVAWQSTGQDSSNEGVYARIFIADYFPSVTNQLPADNSFGIGVNPNLQVTVTDADGQSITVYFYDNTTGTPLLLGTDIVANGGPGIASCPWNGREYRMKYKWFVNVTDGKLNTTSSIWSFTTQAEPVNIFLLLRPSIPEGIPGFSIFFLLSSIGIAILLLMRMVKKPFP